MNDVRVRPLFFCSIFVMAALPLLAAFYLLNRTLETSLDLGFNPRIVRVLDHGAQNLKSLRRLDPDHQELYRRQFVEFQELRHVYASPELLKSNVLRSLRVYFGAGLIVVVVLSVLVAVLLSRRISLAYSANFAELMRHRTQMRYLQEISSWQEMAKMLAHEIKNPLTPIEILLSMVSIVNDGPPVPSDIADRIFDPYVSTKGDRDNMGLGLAIVRKIVIEHGGDIEYQEQGGHPCFLITLPRMAHA